MKAEQARQGAEKDDVQVRDDDGEEEEVPGQGGLGQVDAGTGGDDREAQADAVPPVGHLLVVLQHGAVVRVQVRRVLGRRKGLFLVLEDLLRVLEVFEVAAPAVGSPAHGRLDDLGVVQDDVQDGGAGCEVL